jgi:hypothetical protein
MRKLALLAVVAFAAACGSSSTSPPTDARISGQVNTRMYTSASQLAVVTSGDTCTITQAPGFTLGVSLATVQVSDLAYTCATPTCLTNARNLRLVIAKVHVQPAGTANPAPPFTTGTYQFANLNALGGITPDAAGNIAIFTGDLTTLGAAPVCNPLANGQYTVGPTSTLTVTSVSGSVLTGNVGVQLMSGSDLADGLGGTFTTENNCTPSPAPSACVLLNEIINALK